MCTALILATINLVMVYVGRQGQKGTRGQDDNKNDDRPQHSFWQLKFDHISWKARAEGDKLIPT